MQRAGQPCGLGGLAGGSFSTTLVRFSVNIHVVPCHPPLQAFSMSQAFLPHRHRASGQVRCRDTPSEPGSCFAGRLVLKKGRTVRDAAQGCAARGRYITYPHTCTHTNYEYLYCISASKFHSSHIPFSEILHRYRTSSLFFFPREKSYVSLHIGLKQTQPEAAHA